MGVSHERGSPVTLARRLATQGRQSERETLSLSAPGNGMGEAKWRILFDHFSNQQQGRHSEKKTERERQSPLSRSAAPSRARVREPTNAERGLERQRPERQEVREAELTLTRLGWAMGRQIERDKPHPHKALRSRAKERHN